MTLVCVDGAALSSGTGWDLVCNTVHDTVHDTGGGRIVMRTGTQGLTRASSEEEQSSKEPRGSAAISLPYSYSRHVRSVPPDELAAGKLPAEVQSTQTAAESIPLRLCRACRALRNPESLKKTAPPGRFLRGPPLRTSNRSLCSHGGGRDRHLRCGSVGAALSRLLSLCRRVRSNRSCANRSRLLLASCCWGA